MCILLFYLAVVEKKIKYYNSDVIHIYIDDYNAIYVYNPILQ